MHVTLVHVQVKSDHVNAFIEAFRNNHKASILEAGNLRFVILQSPDDPYRFVLYEAYADARTAVAHKQTAHYLHWHDTVAGWMAAPRQGQQYNALYPEGEAS